MNQQNNNIINQKYYYYLKTRRVGKNGRRRRQHRLLRHRVQKPIDGFTHRGRHKYGGRRRHRDYGGISNQFLHRFHFFFQNFHLDDTDKNIEDCCNYNDCDKSFHLTKYIILKLLKWGV
jgi:hypothetical protein